MLEYYKYNFIYQEDDIEDFYVGCSPVNSDLKIAYNQINTSIVQAEYSMLKENFLLYPYTFKKEDLESIFSNRVSFTGQ